MRGKEAKLSYMGHALMENRNGLVVDGLASRATGQAECLAGEVMVMRREEPDRAVTVGADKAYDTAEFVRTCKAFGAEAHAARNTAGRRSNIGEETAASEGYQASQVHRKRIEEVFGWVKTVARLSKTRHRGLARVDWQFTLALAAYDLIRLRKLLRTAARPPAPGAGPPSGAPSRRGRQGFPPALAKARVRSAAPLRCIRRLVPFEDIDPTDTITPKGAYKTLHSGRSSAAC